MIVNTYDQVVQDKLSSSVTANTSFTNQIVIESQGTKVVYSIEAGYFPPATNSPQETSIVGSVIVAEGKLMGDILINPFPAAGVRNILPFLRDNGLTRIIKILPIRVQGTTIFQFSDTRPAKSFQDGPLSIIQTAAWLYDSGTTSYVVAVMLASLQIDAETLQAGKQKPSNVFDNLK